ncbi:TPA: hypothetical protein ACGBG5_000841 [Enterococcus faecalis]|uniref:hypothetical protein n=1 Tax=Enterococcus faecalis TaxID=1351 RepID=UPI0036D59725
MTERNIDKKIQNILKSFIESYKDSRNLTPKTSQLFYDFIILSYHSKREKRYSISMLSELLLQEGIEVKLLINIYAHSLYVLALNDNKKIYGKGFLI